MCFPPPVLTSDSGPVLAARQLAEDLAGGKQRWQTELKKRDAGETAGADKLTERRRAQLELQALELRCIAARQHAQRMAHQSNSKA